MKERPPVLNGSRGRSFIVSGFRLPNSLISRRHPFLTLEHSKKKSPSCRMGKVQGSRRNPAQRFRWESEEKVCLAHEKSPKAFFIALGLFLSLERATRLELASRHPTNGLRPFAGTLPHLGLKTRFARRWR